MRKSIIECGDHQVSLYLPDGAEGSVPMVYSCMFGDEAEETAEWLFEKEGPAARALFAAISGGNWDDQLSPWPAPRAFKGGNDFGGGAAGFLEELTGGIMPETEKAAAAMGVMPEYSAIAGYSLAGLFAVYAVMESDAFRRGASASGSLWFDGFTDHMEKWSGTVPEKFYFSLGNKEKNTKNQRMATVEERTLKAETMMRGFGAETVFESNEGGHFSEPERRTARGIRWMLG